MATIRGPAFVGRNTERDVLDGLMARVRGGESEALVIHGEAGIGKSALLRYAARQASGFRVAELTGVEAEMELPLAGVHQLCATMLDRLDALPAPQRDALSVALGLAAGEVPERFLVGLAVLSLLAGMAEERPLLCLVEDAQWLDGASSQVLGLVARRVRAESVAIIIAMREPTAEQDFRGLPELRLEGLPEPDATAHSDRRQVQPGQLVDKGQVRATPTAKRPARHLDAGAHQDNRGLGFRAPHACRTTATAWTHRCHAPPTM